MASRFFVWDLSRDRGELSKIRYLFVTFLSSGGRIIIWYRPAGAARSAQAEQ